MPYAPPHHPLSHLTSQIQNVLLDGLGEFSLASVDMFHCSNPDIRAGQRQINDIAFLDVPRVEKGSQDGEECTGILQVCKNLLAPLGCGDAQSGRSVRTDRHCICVLDMGPVEIWTVSGARCRR